MRKILPLILVGLSILSCSSKKYLLTDKNSENRTLIDFIDQRQKEGDITKNPVIVINDKVIEKKDLKSLEISSAEITSIGVIEKGNTEMTQIYGKESLKGIILIETDRIQINSDKSNSEPNVLYLVDGEEYSSEQIKKIHPNDIDNLTVYKGESVKKYTTENYDGVIIIVMKK